MTWEDLRVPTDKSQFSHFIMGQAGFSIRTIRIGTHLTTTKKALSVLKSGWAIV